MWGMKFNERELAIWSTTLVADREGLLEKKGAGRGQGYKQRWFRLKGNLLFYFRVDDAGQWQETGEPLGMIILERCRVDAYAHETRPYTFALKFENDDSRSYLLSASSQQELEGWIIAIKAASYEGLRTMLYKLQKKLMSLTGEDPLLDKGVSMAPGAGDASPSLRNKHTVRRSAYLRSPQIDRAKRINSLQVFNQITGPQYELSLSCVKLPLDDSGDPPSTLVRIRSYASPHDKDAHSTLSHTEVVKSCCNPSYSHLILMEVGLLCPESGLLEFEVFSVDSATVVRDELERSTCPINQGNVMLRAASPDRDSSSPEHTELRIGRRMGRAECLVRTISNTEGKELKLALSEGSLVCGFLHVLPLKLEDIMTSSPKLSRRNAIRPLDRGSPLGVLPPIMSHPIRCHFSFPATDQHKMKVIEEMAESVFNVQVPMELLRCYSKEDRTHLEELYTIGALDETWLRLLQEYQGMLFETIGSYNHALKELESVADTCGFKPSVQKKDIALKFVPCNLHVQRMRVQPEGRGEKAYAMVTLGCPAHHLDGFKNGGLKRLLSECRSSPSFISRSEGKASTVKTSIAGLQEIQKHICHYKNALFRACANAWPQDMNDAIIGISKQVQRLLWQMQSSVVTEAIEGLIMARPAAMGEKGEGTGGGSKRGTLQKENKKQSLKRHSVAVGGAKGPCTCGKCCRCIPSPSDWVWNGCQFVQVSTREWKLTDSCESVQRSLVALVEAVELATMKVVDQQHEAVASEVGYTLTTFQPSYVWSSDLIPLFSRLNQTLDGMLRVAISSLSFSLVQLDSYVQGLKALKRRRDVVFSQALTSLVTCFYLVLSQHLTDAHFLRQIREIGFLVQYESLLSSLGDESGMLEDAYVGVLELGNVTFQLAELQGPDADEKFDFHLSGTRDCLTVQLLLDRAYLSSIPDEKLRVGERISVVPVIFTQGVNEKQTLANFKQHIQLQEEINLESISALSDYVEKYQQLMAGPESTGIHREQAAHAEALLKALKQSYATHKSKNIEFLLKVGELCRLMQGGRLVCCKSGKDRTSMSVTLEECCLLRNKHNLLDSAFMTTLQTLRSHGTRLENCLKNTGHKCYHFNQLQLMLLPRLLTPPLYTCRDPE